MTKNISPGVEFMGYSTVIHTEDKLEISPKGDEATWVPP